MLTKICLVKAMVFPVVLYRWMWEMDHKEGWTLKNCTEFAGEISSEGIRRNSAQFQIVVLEKTLERPLNCKEIKPVYPKGNKSWILIGRIDAEAPILWRPDANSRLIGKDPDARKDWRQEEKGATEDKMVECHHWLNGHEFSKLWAKVKDREAWCAAVHGVSKSQTRLSDWTTTIKTTVQVPRFMCCVLLVNALKL